MEERGHPVEKREVQVEERVLDDWRFKKVGERDWQEEER